MNSTAISPASSLAASRAPEKPPCRRHLQRAAAAGKSVLIITVADIMSAMKDTFSNRETSEEQLLNDLSNVDLLVIDEIGVQTESRYEKVIINQIVDRRSSSKRPTGMLTNHNIDEMTRCWANASWIV
jgi:DNA replication protein DnaC